jgi:threonine dehydratase
LTITLSRIRAAADAIRGHVARTPLALSRTLSELTGAEVWLKFENMQFTASFKERGALNAMLALRPDQARQGVIAMSAGNHAQAVAYHARRLGIAATIVMPRGTPLIKVIQTEGHAARVVLEGDDLASAAAHAHRLAAEQNLCFVHPYDNPHVIAGQGTLALEVIEDRPDIEIMVVPIGGGGLISGVALALKAIKPDIEIVGVQAERYPFMREALSGDQQSVPTGATTIAEGIAVKQVGSCCVPIVRALVDEIVLVSETRIERAVSLMLMIEKTVAEGAAAAVLAALLARPERFRGRRTCLVVSGGNIDQRLLAAVLMRDLPGELARVAAEVATAGANIVDVAHHSLMSDLTAKETELKLLIEVRGDAQADAVMARLRDIGFVVRGEGVG